jgi:hypothetical protein
MPAILPLIGSVFNSSNPTAGSARHTDYAMLAGPPTCRLDGEWIALEISQSEDPAIQVATEALQGTATQK